MHSGVVAFEADEDVLFRICQCRNEEKAYREDDEEK